MVTVDSLRADRLGYSGHAPARTPNMDGLAARGRVFTSAFTPSPEAVPALASLHTGQYPATHGLRGEGAYSSWLGQESVTMAERLKEAGYLTAACAGSLELHPKFGLDQGFDLYAASFAEEPRPSLSPETGLPASRVTGAALEFLETARGSPFFLWINYYDPHYFYAPPEPFATQLAGRPYDGEVAYVDQELGRVLAKLDDYGIKDKTIVVLAGSNGEGLGDNGEAYHGTLLHGATTRVPLVIAGPGLDGPSRAETNVSLVDLAPTLLELAGAAGLPSAEGLSLLRAPDPSRPIYLETRMPARLFGWTPLTAVVRGSLKYVSGDGGGLFDLAVDPTEARNLAASRTGEFQMMRDMAAAHDGNAARSGPRDRDRVNAEIRSLRLKPDAAPRPPKEPAQMVEVANDALKADRSLRRGMVEAAAFLTEGVLRRDPENYLALLDSALLHAARGDAAAAGRQLERAQALYPQASEVYHQMGHLILDAGPQGQAEMAHRLFGVAAELDPLNEEALYDLACARAVDGRLTAALDALEQAVKAGFRDFEWMAEDSDLDPLRSDPRFDRITQGKSRKAAAASAPAGR